MRLKLLLVSFFVSLFFWWGLNNLAMFLSDSLFWLEISVNPDLLLAQSHQDFLQLKLKKIKEVELLDLELKAKAALAMRVRQLKKGTKEQKILFKKNINQPLPIASLTKLMTALVVLENYSLEEPVKISPEAVAQEENIGNFRVGETFLVKDLLYSMLIESSNDAAFALSEIVGLPKFVELMNSTAKKIGLSNTHFVNSTGLEPDEPGQPFNLSTAKDLAKLTSYLLEKHAFLCRVLSLPQKEIYQADNKKHHLARTTNQLLGKVPGIIAGKTGYADKAGGCFILVLKGRSSDEYLINVILGSEDRFGQMEKLVERIKQIL